jgi:hypothetical protein
MNMHPFLLIILLLMTVIPCSPGQTAGAHPELAERPALNQLKAAAQEGITGWVYQEAGNRMPMPGRTPQKPKGLSTTIYIYELTNLAQTSRVGFTPFYTAIGTKPVATTHSDSTGAFTIRLAPGNYSLFVKLDGRFYANSFDSNNNVAPVTVKKGKRSRVTILVNPDAVY